MSVHDYKPNATLNNIEEVLRVLPTIHKNIHVTFGISCGSSCCYNTYVNIEDGHPYHHIKMNSLQEAYDRFFKLLSISDTVEFQKKHIQSKLDYLRENKEDIDDEIASLQTQLIYLQGGIV